MEADRPGGNTAGEMPGLFPFESGSGSTGIGRGCPSIPVRPPASGHRAGHRRFIPRELEGSHSFLMDKKRVSAILNEIGMLLEVGVCVPGRSTVGLGWIWRKIPRENSAGN